MDFKMDALEKRFNVKAEEESVSTDISAVAPQQPVPPAAPLPTKPVPPDLAAAKPAPAAPQNHAAPAAHKPAPLPSKPVPPTLQATAKPPSAFKMPSLDLHVDADAGGGGGARGPINPVQVSQLPPPLPRQPPPPPNPNASGGGAREARPDALPSSSAAARAKLVAAMSGDDGVDVDLGMVCTLRAVLCCVDTAAGGLTQRAPSTCNAGFRPAQGNQRAGSAWRHGGSTLRLQAGDGGAN